MPDFVFLLGAVPFAFLFLWLWLGFWLAVQFTIVIFFAVIGLMIGSAISPGDRVAEGLAMIPMAAFGLLVARRATEELSRFTDRLSERYRRRD